MQVRPLDSAGHHLPPHKQFGVVGGFQLNQDLSVFDVPLRIVGQDGEVNSIVMNASFHRVPAQERMSLDVVGAQVGDDVFARSPLCP
jgi:hypothetical protein